MRNDIHVFDRYDMGLRTRINDKGGDAPEDSPALSAAGHEKFSEKGALWGQFGFGKGSRGHATRPRNE